MFALKFSYDLEGRGQIYYRESFLNHPKHYLSEYLHSIILAANMLDVATVTMWAELIV